MTNPLDATLPLLTIFAGLFMAWIAYGIISAQKAVRHAKLALAAVTPPTPYERACIALEADMARRVAGMQKGPLRGSDGRFVKRG